MGVIRRRLVWLATVGLVCQLAGFATAPTLLAFGVATVDDDCGCPNVAPGQVCPMHHHARKGKDDGTCKMRSGCQPPEVALLSMAGGPGILPSPTQVVIAFDLAAALVPGAPQAIARAARPESPPPRS
jgi:hypothetical protein